MVEAPGHVGVERVLAGVATGPVPAVVPERDGLGEGDVEAAGPGDGRGDLRHLERVGEPGALMVLGEHEDLGLAGQPTEGGGVEDAVAVALEAGAPLVGCLGLRPVAGARRRGWRRAPAASSSSSSRSARPLGDGEAGRRRRGRRRGAGAMRACESAWARRTGPE